MGELETIQAAVRRAAQRRRWQRAWVSSWQGLLIGASGWLLAIVLYKVAPIPFDVVIAAAGFAAACVLAGFIYGWLRKPSLSQTAQWLDEKTHLQERLSTALEFVGKPTDENWKQLLIVDAATHAKNLNTKNLLPFSLPKASRWALLVLAVGAGLGFVPEYRSKQFVERQQEKEVIKESGAKLVELTKKSLEVRKPSLEPVHEALQSTEQLGEALMKNPVTRSEALKDLSSVTDRLQQELKDLGKSPGVKALDRAARNSTRSGANVPGETQRQIDSLQKQLGNKAGTPEALEKLKDELQKAQQAAAGMPSPESAAGASAHQQMTQTLQDLARQAQQMGVDLPDLNEAIAALQAEKTDLFLKDLDQAVTDLEKVQQMAEQLQQLQNASSKLGKDLAEQLKNGQAEHAQQTLQKMIDQLQKVNLSPEQLQKMLEEVTKAVDPASEYGKVAEHLKGACKQMKAGQKPGAAQSLSAAADELKKLLEQMNDAQQLMAALENLKRAQMCVGNCKKWGMCQGNCNKPGFKPGGKPGSGVGTWADETGWINIPETVDRWDNSGIERPDMDGKGPTDRGEGEVPSGLDPQKIRGQFSPGGPMPSITLKGVSIKGQSTVQYQEAVSAAQSEAQSAVNQDQVPRAYRGAVRDYFDDLKP